MSASKSKKEPKQLDPKGLSFRELAEQKQAEKKKKNLKTALISVAAIVVALAIIFGVIALVNAPYRKTVATVGSEKINVPVYNSFYNANANNMYQYLSYFGAIKPNVPLSEQANPMTGEGTMEDYMIEATNQGLQQTYNLYIKAKADKNFSLSDEAKKNISDSVNALTATATNYGFGSVNDYLRASVGRGAKVSDYEEYLTVATTASEYSAYLEENFAPSDDELKTKYEASAEDFDFVFYTYSMTNAKSEETSTTENSEDAKTPTYTDEAKAAAKTEAEEKQENMPEDATTTHQQKASIGNEELASWLFDSARKEGDTTVIAQNEEGTSYMTVRFESRETNDYTRVNAYILSISRKVEEADEKNTEETSEETTEQTTEETSEETTEQTTEEKTEPTPDEKFATLKEGLKDDMSDEDFETYVKGLEYTPTVRPMDKYSSTDEINAWLYDSARKAGDMETFETEDTYYLVRYSSAEEMTYRNVLVKDNLYHAMFDALSTELEVQIDKDALAYANTDLTFRSQSSDTAS